MIKYRFFLTWLTLVPFLSPGLLAQEKAKNEKAKDEKAAQENAEPAKGPQITVVPGVPAIAPAGAAIPMMRMAPAMQAGAKAGPGFDLSDLVLAKVEMKDKGAQLVALVEETRTEEREVTVTRMNAEVRKRTVTVKDKDGNPQEVEQEFTVMVPTTANVTIPYQVAVGKKPKAFPVAQIKFYKLDGSVMDATEATKNLQKMTPVFLVRNPNVEIKAIDEIYQRALSRECVIAVVSP